ncbi:MAG: DUF5916 domain-containing protein [Pseudomonadota bacterium]
MIAVVAALCAFVATASVAAVPGATLVVPTEDGTSLTLDYRANPQIKLDGILDEPAWQGIDAIENFVSVEPDTLEPGTLPTRMLMFYNERGFYLGAELTQDPATLLQRLSGRDQGGLNRDYVSLILDTSGEARYGFWFQVSLGDSVSDGTILPEQQFSANWDGAWQRSSRRTDTGWAAEVFIPWSLVNMPKATGKRTLAVALARRVAHLNERWSWPALAFTQPRYFSRFQKIEVENVSPRQQWAVFPYAASTIDQFDDTTSHKAGFEAFWRPSTNFQATTTINPDFGTVEADDVIVNFSANEVFLPERRLFFVEGQEIFNTSPRSDGQNNRNPVTLVNTRRIGGRPVGPDVPSDASLDAGEANQLTELLGAFKTTGQIGGLRFGVLGAFENETKFDATTDAGESINLHQDGSDYAAVRALYEIDRAGAYAAAGWLTTAVLHPTRDAYVHALDLHHKSANRKLSTDVQLIASDITDERNGFGAFTDLNWNQRQGLNHSLQLEYFDEHLDINDLGFQRRVDTYGVRYSFRHTKSDVSWLQNMITRGFMGGGWNTAGERVLAGFNLRQELVFKSLNRIQYGIGYSPARYDDRNSFDNGSFRIDGRLDWGLGFSTDNTRRISLNARVNYDDGDIGGRRYTYNTGLTWRVSNRLTAEASLRHRDRSAWLLHDEDTDFVRYRSTNWSPRLNLDFFPTARQQFRLAMQWVAIDARERDFFSIAQDGSGRLLERTKAADAPSDDFTVSRINFQVRYRWEIAPLSDLFVVYTRNASLPSAPGSNFGDLFSDGFDATTAEQLVVKLRYRLGS